MWPSVKASQALHVPLISWTLCNNTRAKQTHHPRTSCNLFVSLNGTLVGSIFLSSSFASEAVGVGGTISFGSSLESECSLSSVLGGVGECVASGASTTSDLLAELVSAGALTSYSNSRTNNSHSEYSGSVRVQRRSGGTFAARYADELVRYVS